MGGHEREKERLRQSNTVVKKEREERRKRRNWRERRGGNRLGMRGRQEE